jgi:hypothetical protein
MGFTVYSIAIPLAILFLGIIVYYYKYNCRFANGIALLVLGSMGWLLYPIACLAYNSIRMLPVADVLVIQTIVFVVIVLVEIPTFYVGVQSLRKRNRTH